MNHKIAGIYNIEELDRFGGSLNVRVFLKYPDFNDLISLAPKERMKAIRKQQRTQYKEFVVKYLPNKTFTRIGSKIALDGVEIECTKKELLTYGKDKSVGHLSIIEKNDGAKERVEELEYYYAVVVRFAIQLENKEKGLQSYEDRTLLMKAKSGEEAEKKLQKSFKKYEEPYLNSRGEMVRWKFEAFVDCYETIYQSLEDMLEDEEEGIEVFSIIKNRRLNKERSWIQER
ncbi:MAG: DUF4288 domain-containing protein [Chitinophagales bacterium]